MEKSGQIRKFRQNLASTILKQAALKRLLAKLPLLRRRGSWPSFLCRQEALGICPRQVDASSRKSRAKKLLPNGKRFRVWGLRFKV
jgi:hypothetical protein